jgi:hypothetical protein
MEAIRGRTNFNLFLGMFVIRSRIHHLLLQQNL